MTQQIQMTSGREYAKVAWMVTGVMAAIVLSALAFRAFLFEPFRMPSGSMLPTIGRGDHIVVNKFVYGLRIPLTKIRFLKNRDPKRGEMLVFIYPVDESKSFIKRLVGLSGDHIRIEGLTIWVNGEALQRVPVEVSELPGDQRVLSVRGGDNSNIPYDANWNDFDYFEEHLGNADYLIQYEHQLQERKVFDAVVPSGHYFVMGDNRDNSADSREWGFVPEENVMGKAVLVWHK